ncbi:hypothetical protein F4821DRAFT_251912 [Hypoxylon rubiginosum]|uniref:Uncharacterized protein n=1 Tax=Hypoxylon rubiginosum TaxID=110542 RepID=A0ACC0CIS0_9PEZI|nr:hypothetical protein F4821DRAFT_251912 [Hypoxylon rubiginosum]
MQQRHHHHHPYYQQTTDFMARQPPPPAYQPHRHGGGTPVYVENVYANKANLSTTSYHGSPIGHYGDMMESAYPPPPPPPPSQQSSQVAMPHLHSIDPSLM